MPDPLTEELLKFPRLSSRRQLAAVVVVSFKASLLMLCGCIPVAYTYNLSGVCAGVLVWPMLAFGLFLMAIFCCGCNANRHDNECLGALYLIGLFVAIPSILAFVIFGYIAVGGIDLGRSVEDHEYNLTDYRGWLRGRVADPQYWSKISACLHNKHACDAMGQLVRDPETGIFVPKISWAEGHDVGKGPMPIESGCCKPPSSCGFTYVNGTTWMPTPGAPAMETNVDCSRWSNEPQTLCFQCDSCRAGFLDESKRGWTVGAIFPIITLIVLSASCCLMAKIGTH